MMHVRRFKSGEEDTLRQICRDTTLNVNTLEYGSELVDKWAARLHDSSKWKERIQRTNPFVVEKDGVIIGFAELAPTGKISAFYSHYQWQRKGIGSALYEVIEAEASKLDIDCLKVETSLSASGFFKRKGFHIVEENTNLTDGIPSKSLLMRKQL